MNRILLCLLILGPLLAHAHRPEDGKVYGAFGPYLYQTVQYEEEFHSPYMGGWALTGEGDLNRYGGLELTLLYMNPIFALERDDKKIVEQVKRMYIAMGWRHWFGRDFSISPSFFSSYVMGDAKIVRSDFVGVSDTPHTSARDPVDYGFALSLQLEAFHFDRFAMVVDARYSHSVTPKQGEDMNQVGVFAALKYFIQSTQPEDSDEF